MSSVSPSASAPIIAFCHLRWDFVWQRPQQFLSRFSKTRRVLFVEGPQVHDANIAPHFTLHNDARFPNVTILQTHFSQRDWAKGGIFIDALRRELLENALRGPLKGKFERAMHWFYDPMAVESHLGQHGVSLTIYDCMDELSQFKFAPPELVQRERRLLCHADVVFAGGRKMREAKARFNANSHFYGCGVDVEHYAAARHTETEVPEDIAHLEGKVLGYFGVVDERLDYELITQLADANPNWHVVMIGPTAKIDPQNLPQRANLYWLGGRDYSQLPAYTKRFDVCLMPFARNEATEYINPTKALEYMATGTPIVSSDVPDVVANFSSVCKIATSPREFVQLCLREAETPDALSVQRGLKMANDNTWDSIVAKMQANIEDAAQKRADIERQRRALSYHNTATVIASAA